VPYFFPENKSVLTHTLKRCATQNLFAMLRSGSRPLRPAEGFDALDAERFDDGLDGHDDQLLRKIMKT
jgi:hypothetical protein